jgi:vesicle coat complex subunit
MQILATYKENRIQFSQYQIATQKKRKKFLSNTTITTSAVIMVATPTINRLQKKRYKKSYNTYKNNIAVSA